MNIFAFGVNHKSPIEVLEKSSVTKEKIPSVLRELCTVDSVQEAVIVSTCNRTEFYLVLEYMSDANMVEKWMQDKFSISNQELNQHFYGFKGTKAIQHLMEVACGLDSAVIGETQILGQIKESYMTALSLGMTRKTLNRLFQRTIHFAKYVHSHYKINDNSLSTNYLVGQYIKEHITAYTDKSFLVIGAGENSQSFIKMAQDMGIHDITLSNRDSVRGEAVASNYGVDKLELRDLSKSVDKFDIIFTSTSSEDYLIDKLTLSSLHVDQHGELVIFDCAIPRDVDPDVSLMPRVKLINLDLLTQMKNTNEKVRFGLKQQIKKEIQKTAKQFEQWLLENEAKKKKYLCASAQ